MICEELEIWWAYLRGAKGFFRKYPFQIKSSRGGSFKVNVVARI
jgi:hypothetical protein